ncbi:MAG: methyltransferase [Rhodospirillales bacterium]|nr:methyltransferase [Rhodospirillales bacterium]
MERQEYEKLHAVEDEMWWFHGMHANLLAAFSRRRPAVAGNVLDAGCGTGGLLAKLSSALPGWSPIGLDADAEACRLAHDKSGRPVACGSVNRPPVAEGSFAAIFSADVLCHRNVDEADALAGFHRGLARDGLLVLNLPAYQWLLSEHDHAVHNVRRYTARRVRRLLQRAGFSSIRTTYWNSVLFPLMASRRLVGSRPSVSDVMNFPRPIELAFRGIMRFETMLLRHGLVLPYGGSILATALKQ